MPRVPTLSPATGKPVPAHYVHTTAGQFVDTSGRTLIFRGVNLSGSSKAPAGQQSQLLEGFWESAEEGKVSFINQPLNVDDGTADVHLARLRGWGFNFLRFPVTWEALEHAGPKRYDYEFMDYVVRILRKCKEHGFKVFMDPHQDVWSRFTGGSGAPLWTIYACGMDPRNLSTTYANVLHCEYPSRDAPDPITFPGMMWSTNYGRLTSQTLYTMFFAGRTFTPKCIIDGVNIQDWLQDHFIAAFGLLADKIRDAGDLLDVCVVGWDSLNEPSEGFIGYPDLTTSSKKQSPQLKKGPFAVPAQSFRLSMGQAQTLENWVFGGFGPAQKGTVTIDPKGVTAWLSPNTEEGGVNPRWGWKRDPGWTLGTCVWALHGVWDIQSGVVLLPHYFRHSEPEVPFTAEYFRPHWQKYVARIRQSHPEAIHFVQPPVFVQPPSLDEADHRGRLSYSTHYYDGLTLVSRHWHWYNADAVGVLRGKYSAPWQATKLGEAAVRKSLQEQLGVLKADCPAILGDYPTVIGEIGVPIDLDDGWSYGYTDNGKGLGNYREQTKALDASLNGCDGVNALNYTIWTYVADGSHKWGDGWNGEDLSLWCADDVRAARPKAKFAMDDASSSSSRSGSNENDSAMLLKRAKTDNLRVPPSAFDLTSRSCWKSEWDFLTDGARAYQAFVRPWPHAIVGVPVRWDFDIAKASFSMTVRVSWDDASPHSDEDEANPPTEIYVPLVHFASVEELDKAFVFGAEDGSGQVNPSVSQVSLTTQEPSIKSSKSSKKQDDEEEIEDLLLAVDVKVSDGRWEVVPGTQMLKWWYRVPTRDEGPVEYRIDVKRSGGPIRLAADARVGAAAVESSWADEFCGSLYALCFGQ